MARVLDLNIVQNSIMDLTLQDANRTVVHLDFPTEELVQELEAMQGEFEALKKGDRRAVEKIYDLAASLINCNFDYFKVTGQELRNTYRMNVVGALQFFSAYLSFLEDLKNEKN